MFLSDVWERVYVASQGVFRDFVPTPEDRMLLTWTTAFNAFAYLIPFQFLSYLARRRDTHLLRLLLLPVVILMTVRGTYRYGNPCEPRFFVLSWVRGLAGLLIMAFSFDLAIPKDGRLKVGETTLPAMYEPVPPRRQDSTSKHHISRSPLPLWLEDALHAFLNVRGIGWEFGRGAHIPPEYRSLKKGKFLRQTFYSFVKNFLVVDLCETMLKLFPGIGSPDGGSMFYPDLPLIQRYFVSTIIHVTMGTLMLSGVQALYDGATCMVVVILNQPPTEWPPLFKNPWASDSLHDLWDRRWHQLLRRVFIIYGGYPGYAIAGQTGYILGTFLASGLFHEFGMYMVGRGVDFRVPLFFLLHGNFLLLEGVYKRITGRRVRGTFGRIWVALCFIGMGQMLVDSWLVRGFGSAVLVPPPFRFNKLVLFPALEGLFRWLGIDVFALIPAVLKHLL